MRFTELDPNTRLIDLTVADLQEIMGAKATEVMEQKAEAIIKEIERKKRYVYGIAGIAQLFKCSMTTANRIKQGGVIKAAIAQSGRMITVDADLAVKLMREHKDSKNIQQ